MRKLIYSLLAAPLLIAVIYCAVMPSATRQTFFSEFKHRTAALFGFTPEPRDGPKGLRSERPEEYGLQADAAEDQAPEEASSAAAAD